MLVKLREITKPEDMLTGENAGHIPDMTAVLVQLGIKVWTTDTQLHAGAKTFTYPFLNIEFWQYIEDYRLAHDLPPLEVPVSSTPNLKENMEAHLKAVTGKVVSISEGLNGLYLKVGHTA